jgi:predicted nucleotidyltransferase
LLLTAKTPSVFGGLAVFRVGFHASICDQLVSQAFAGSQVGEQASGPLYRRSTLNSGFIGIGSVSHIGRVVTVAGGNYDSHMSLMTDETLIAEAANRLAAAAPDAKVILFGSRARGEGRSDSDLDLLVIEPELKSRRAEFVRLREALGDLGVPIDLIVLSAEYANQRAEVRGSMVNEALHRGRVLAGA